MTNVLITQSNYIPWKGYIDNIAQCDVFVVFDDMQYTRRDWRNRNYIKTPQGLKWLTIPVQVKGKYYQKINETKVADKKWTNKHLEQIRQNYKKAPYFRDYFPWIEELYKKADFEYLTEVNVFFLKAICAFFDIETKFLDSRDFVLSEDKTERLVSICKELGATDYYTGPAAKNYMQEELFDNENIKVHYFDYEGYPEYNQLYDEFKHGVSIFDLILNEGPDAKNFLKHTK